MNNLKFTSIIDQLCNDFAEEDWQSSFYKNYTKEDAINQICGNSGYTSVYKKAWELVTFIRFEDDSLFKQVEKEVRDNDHNTDDITMDDFMCTYAFQILKISTLKKWKENQSAITQSCNTN